MRIGMLCVLAGATLCAQEPGRFGRGGMMLPPGFQVLDVNQDRAISADEIVKAADSLRKLDQNGDGKLNVDEVRPHFEGRGGRGRGGDGPGEVTGPSADELVNTLMAFDKNGDKKLSKDEIPERMQGLFARADADHDGILTADEIRKSAQSTSAAPAGGGDHEMREGRGGRGMEPPNFMKVDPIFAAVDADGNGEITSAEMANAPAALKKLDKNGDGQITPDEVPMMGGRGRGGR